MKKCKIHYDRKITIALIVYLTVGILRFVLSMLQPIESEMTGFVKILTLALGVYTALLSVIVIKDSFTRVKINNSILSFGLLSGNKFELKDLKKIKVTADIELTNSYQTKKLRVINIGKNEKAYLEILQSITDKANIKIYPESLMEKLKSNNANKYIAYGHPLRLNGWIFILFVMIIISAVSSVFLGLSSLTLGWINSETIYFNSVIVNFIIGVYAIITVVSMAKKRKAAITHIKIFYLINSITTIFNGYISQFNSGEYDFYSILNIVFYLIFSFAILYVIIRYLTVSIRAKNTFTLGRGEAVTKADVKYDPGFKLFSKDMPSLYGLMNFIVLPALIFGGLILFIIIRIFF